MLIITKLITYKMMKHMKSIFVVSEEQKSRRNNRKISISTIFYLSCFIGSELFLVDLNFFQIAAIDGKYYVMYTKECCYQINFYNFYIGRLVGLNFLGGSEFLFLGDCLFGGMMKIFHRWNSTKKIRPYLIQAVKRLS